MMKVFNERIVHVLYSYYRFSLALFQRKKVLRKFFGKDSLKVYYGCGHVKQNSYINVDVRWTPSVDVIGNLQWCSKNLKGQCDEVYLSHVLEHYTFPGKVMRQGSNSVLGALLDIHRMLKPGGVVRIAVPDFGAIAKLYVDGEFTLFPRLCGRLCGEQDYPQNLHKCMFDREFLTFLLGKAGFSNVEDWDPQKLKFSVDASFDCLNGTQTSLNLMAEKI